MIRRDLTKMTLDIYETDIITKITQRFNEDVKSHMTYNAPDTPHKGILHNQETDKNIIHSIEEIQEWCRITNIPCETLTTRII